MSFIHIFCFLPAIAFLIGVSEEKACSLLTKEVADPALRP